MRILYFLLLSLPVFGMVNVPEEPDLLSAVNLAQSLGSVVSESGQLSCDESGIREGTDVPSRPSPGDRRDGPMIRALLRQCLQKRSIRDNVWHRENGLTPVLCTAPNGYKRMKRYYQIGRQNAQIRVRVPIRFTWVPGVSQGSRERAYRKLAVASRCASDFYRRFGLHVSIENVTDATAPVTIISETLGRSSTAHIYMGENENHNACTMMVHEMGHFMGLPDRYADRNCPARNTLMGWDDVMNNGGVYPPELLTLNLIDFHSIIRPLCD